MVSAGGHKLHLYCIGSGSPTVIIEPGIGVDWSGWYRVAPELARSNRICVYDRGGYGWSEAGPQPRTARQLADELHSLLSTAEVAGPYILVAHSFGGYIARTYASRYRDSLAGVVLVDPSNEDEPLPPRPLLRKIAALFPPVDVQRLPRLFEGAGALQPEFKTLPFGFQERFLIGAPARQLNAEREEIAALPQSEAEVRAIRFPRDLPLIVISARHIISPHEYFPPPVPEPLPMHRELHAKLAAESASGRLIAAQNSGHMIQMDQPKLIIQAVRDITAEYSIGRGSR